MSITIERAVAATPELHDLIRELNDVLGAAYESHQRHGLSIEQLFETHVCLDEPHPRYCTTELSQSLDRAPLAECTSA